jgi:hypothetical protein
MEGRITAACILIELFAMVAMTDGVYYHLWKFRLYTRPESIVEHVTHTIHALFFGPIVFLLFAYNFGGALLWLAVAVVALDFANESWDILIEKNSRASLGGLPPLEYLSHAVAITLRTAAIALVFSAKPAAAWSLSSPTVLPESYPSIAPITALLIVPGAVLFGLVHLWLLRPRYRVAVAA